jgi:hypothetical protein
MWLMASKGRRSDVPVRTFGKLVAPWAASQARRASLIVFGFATVAACNGNFMPAFQFVQAALWFIALRTFTLSASRGVSGLSTSTAVAIGYLAGTALSFHLPHALII